MIQEMLKKEDMKNYLEGITTRMTALFFSRNIASMKRKEFKVLKIIVISHLYVSKISSVKKMKYYKYQH
jgi:hypothetical protein